MGSTIERGREIYYFKLYCWFLPPTTTVASILVLAMLRDEEDTLLLVVPFSCGRWCLLACWRRADGTDFVDEHCVVSRIRTKLNGSLVLVAYPWLLHHLFLSFVTPRLWNCEVDLVRFKRMRSHGMNFSLIGQKSIVIMGMVDTDLWERLLIQVSWKQQISDNKK